MKADGEMMGEAKNEKHQIENSKTNIQNNPSILPLPPPSLVSPFLAIPSSQNATATSGLL
jgi:hypothetical protein